ncbi:MAG TPA: hypothetical protein VLA34_12540, partial [Candidatus Krumholzibacterium sp.]|nr:hypothetical protein [Candidatus Krumholzibacterium sp.]
MRRGTLLIVLMVFLYSCTAAPPADMPEQAPGDAAGELLTEIRTKVFENDLRGARKSGQRYLDRFAGFPDEDEVRLITAKADIELGFLGEAGTVLQP